MKLQLLVSLLLCWVGLSAEAMAQDVKKDSIVNLTGKERICFKTNTIDWAFTIANMGFEYDLRSSPYNKYTLGLNVRYAGGANMSFVSKVDFKFLDVRGEFRRYWRQSMTMRRERKRLPKVWRAYYWGTYLGYTDYTIFIPNGYKGKGIQAGGSLGYETSLLKFKRGFLDLDLGLNVGFFYQQYEKSKMIEDERVVVKDQGWKLIPYPMISEIRVGLVYRFKSIREKYTKNKH